MRSGCISCFSSQQEHLTARREQLGERKQQKREAAVAAVKRSEEYRKWERMRSERLVPLHIVREEIRQTRASPSVHGRKQVKLWRNDIKLAAGVMYAL